MLEKERFLEIKDLAKKIRKENAKKFKSFEKDKRDEAIKEKEDFLDSIIKQNADMFSEVPGSKEEIKVFRANVLIPDDAEFYKSYSEDKNIRNLMDKYKVSIEAIMNKITELNIYGKYIEDDNLNKDANTDFVDEMVNMSTKEAENLLSEIENLSTVALSLDDIPDDEIKENDSVKPINIEPKKPVVAKKEIKDEDVDEDFDNISEIVSGFVDEYNKSKEDLEAIRKEKEETDEHLLALEKQISEHDEQVKALEKEITDLKLSNLESADSINTLREEKQMVLNENAELKDEIESMKKKIAKSSELIKKIYNSIPR